MGAGWEESDGGLPPHPILVALPLELFLQGTLPIDREIGDAVSYVYYALVYAVAPVGAAEASVSSPITTTTFKSPASR